MMKWVWPSEFELLIFVAVLYGQYLWTSYRTDKAVQRAIDVGAKRAHLLHNHIKALHALLRSVAVATGAEDVPIPPEYGPDLTEEEKCEIERFEQAVR